MNRQICLRYIKTFLYTVLISMLGCLGIIFCVLYFQTFTKGFVFEYFILLTSISTTLITILTLCAIAFVKRSETSIHKIFFVVVFLVCLTMAFLFLLKKFNILDKFKNIDDLRNYVCTFGMWSIAVFIVIQFLQVVVLPIPSFITVGAGVLLFGPFKGSVFSCVGIISGSIVAYVLGRVFGSKIVKWIVGESTLNKVLKMIRGKDKIALAFMLLFPFFPDDALCFVAGITTVSPTYFISLIFITRIITVFVASYSLNNSIIPYNTWWGILIWIGIFVATMVGAILIYKNGDKLENKLLKIRNNK